MEEDWLARVSAEFNDWCLYFDFFVQQKWLPKIKLGLQTSVFYGSIFNSSIFDPFMKNIE